MVEALSVVLLLLLLLLLLLPGVRCHLPNGGLERNWHESVLGLYFSCDRSVKIIRGLWARKYKEIHIGNTKHTPTHFSGQHQPPTSQNGSIFCLYTPRGPSCEGLLLTRSYTLLIQKSIFVKCYFNQIIVFSLHHDVVVDVQCLVSNEM